MEFPNKKKICDIYKRMIKTLNTERTKKEVCLDTGLHANINNPKLSQLTSQLGEAISTDSANGNYTGDHSKYYRGANSRKK